MENCTARTFASDGNLVPVVKESKGGNIGHSSVYCFHLPVLLPNGFPYIKRKMKDLASSKLGSSDKMLY